MRACDHVIRGVQEVAVEQRLWQPLAAVSRAYLVAQLLELLALWGSDLPVDRIEEYKRCQQVP